MPGGFDPGSFGGGFSDILSNLFGGRRRRRLARRWPARRRRAARGRDLETEVSLTFDQAVDGAQVPLAVPTSQPCPTCHGTGAKPGTTPQGLPGLRGPRSRVPEPGDLLDLPAVLELRRLRHRDRGPVPDVQRHRRAAQRPAAAGQHPGRACATAAASGWPARASPGCAAPASPATCIVITRVRIRRCSSASGDNLEVEVPLTIPEAIRGAVIEVPTLNGSKRLRVPARDQARHRPAAARRRSAAAQRQGPRRHPLPVRDRRAGVAVARAVRGG